MRNLVLSIGLTLAGVGPAQATLVYLNGDEVLDSVSGYVWLDLSLTAGMGLDNIYTQNGWQIANVPNSVGVGGPGNYIATHPFSLLNGFAESTTYGLPYNPDISTLIEFMAGDADADYFSAWALWGDDHIASASATYSRNEANQTIYFDGSEALLIEDYNSYGSLALYRQATAEELTIAVTNGGFESNTFLGWGALGDVSLQQSSIGIAPTDGSYQAVISTLCDWLAAQYPDSCSTTNRELPYSNTNALATEAGCDGDPCWQSPVGTRSWRILDLIGVNMNDLQAISGYDAAPISGGEGSALRYHFDANAGDTISVDYNYVTQDNDWALIALIGMDPGSTLRIVHRVIPGSAPSGMQLCQRVESDSSSTGDICPLDPLTTETGYHQFSHQFLESGTYTIGFAVAEIEDGTVPTAMLIDNLTLTRAVDTDGDTVADGLDNCRLVPNALTGNVPGTSILKYQLDSDHDGYGNACDADLNNSGSVTATDYSILRSVLGELASYSPFSAAADMNGSGTVTAADYSMLRSRIGTPPGPSGLACAGSVPCPSP